MKKIYCEFLVLIGYYAKKKVEITKNIKTGVGDFDWETVGTGVIETIYYRESKLPF